MRTSDTSLQEQECSRHCSVGAGIDLLTQWSSRLVSDPAFVPLMTIVERLILYADVGLLLWWVIVSTYDAIVELHDE